MFSSFHLVCIPQSWKVAMSSNCICGALLKVSDLFMQNVKVMLVLFDSFNVSVSPWKMHLMKSSVHNCMEHEHHVWAFFFITCPNALK